MQTVEVLVLPQIRRTVLQIALFYYLLIFWVQFTEKFVETWQHSLGRCEHKIQGAKLASDVFTCFASKKCGQPVKPNIIEVPVRALALR